MAKGSTKKTETTTETVVAAVPAAPTTQKTPKVKAAKASTPAPAPAVEPSTDAPKASKKASKAQKAEVAPVVVQPVVEASSPVATEAAVDSQQVSSDFSSFATKLQQVSALLSALRTEFRTLEKRASRELKTATKAGAKRKRKTGNRSPSGFVKPTLISGELATFLGKSQGTEMARTEVTREINAYIRANSLQDKSNGRKINADAKLSSLLKLKADEELTYFNLQRYMSPHFQKSAPATAEVAA
jgi:upstream activation factor subunit UAF30